MIKLKTLFLPVFPPPYPCNECPGPSWKAIPELTLLSKPQARGTMQCERKQDFRCKFQFYLTSKFCSLASPQFLQMYNRDKNTSQTYYGRMYIKNSLTYELPG